MAPFRVSFGNASCQGWSLKYALMLAAMAGVAVALQVSLTAEAQKTLGPVVVVAISGFTTGFTALIAALFLVRPEITTRAVSYSVASGVLGAFIVGAIAFSAGTGGVARALSLVIAAQLLLGLVLDAMGIFGGSAHLSMGVILGVMLILAGGVLVVRQ